MEDEPAASAVSTNMLGDRDKGAAYTVGLTQIQLEKTRAEILWLCAGRDPGVAALSQKGYGPGFDQHIRCPKNKPV